MKNLATLATFFGLASLGSAHMEISQPPPLRSKFNDFTTDVDYSMTNPLSQSGNDFPCKGYLNLVGTPQGQSVTTYNPGETYQMTITGGTIHNGGSCQVSLSFDQGTTWTVIHSYIGNCPSNTGDTNYDFTIPNDTPNGEAIFAWTWFNNVGNREMYMNCAVVTIGGGGAKDAAAKRAPEDPFDSRPDMFVANVGQGCSTVETKDVEFPEPGPDVTRDATNGEPVPPTCNGGAGGQKSSVPSAPAPPPSSAAPSKTQPTEPATTNPVSSTHVPGGVFIPAPEEPKPSSTEGGFAAGEACEQEGNWNCVGGSQFQRCASGAWTELTAVSAGTTCTEGQSSSLLIAREEESPAKNHAKVLRGSRYMTVTF